MNNLNKQNGMALVIGLIVLFIMTLLGVSSMSTTTTGLKMANNEQFHNTSFQAAASIFEFSLSDPVDPTTGPLIEWTKTIESGAAVSQTVMNFDSSTLNEATAEATVVYTDCRKVVIGSSLRGPTFKGLVHEVSATGRAVNSNADILATSQQTLGVQTIRPGCPTL